MLPDLLHNTVVLALDAAPWLLLGLLAAGIIKAWLSEGIIGRWLGGTGPWPVVKAAVIGAPLPLCSCGVLPAALALHRGGASRGATISFLVATPETGVDSIAVSYALLGPFMTIVRPIAALISAITSGTLAMLVPQQPPKRSPFAFRVESTASCSGGSCCTPQTTPKPLTPLQRSLQGVRYALSDILDDIAPWLLIGLLAAGLIATFVPPMTLASWGSGLPAMVVMLLVGIPMYICATASTPLAAALLLAGVSPGTVLVFLLAGPATNIATLAVLRKELGMRVLVSYLAGIALSSITLGLLTDRLVAHFNIDIRTQLAANNEMVPLWIAICSALLLLLFAIKPLRRLVMR